MAITYKVAKNDTLNSISQRYGFKNYKEAGISGYKSGNPDLIYAGEVLTIGKVPSSPSTTTKDTANAFINANQDADINAGNAKDEAPVRGEQEKPKSLFDTFTEMTGKSNITPSLKNPKAPKYESTYNDLRKEYGIGGLEDGLNDLEAEEAELVARRRERTNAERDKTVAMNVITGRVGEVERQESERLDYIVRQKQQLVNQLSTANSAIENIMNFRKLDYDTAKGAYDSEFSQNIQLFNVVKGVRDDAISEIEREEDNARANLNIIYGAFKDGGIDPDSIDATTAYNVSKLEIQAGLPSGFYQKIAKSNPEGKILSTTTRTTSGAKYADILTRNPDGSIVSKSVYLGATNEGSGSGDKETEAEMNRRAVKSMATDMNSMTGEDGYISPADYRAGKQNWISAGFSGKDFDASFSSYANPDHLYDYGL